MAPDSSDEKPNVAVAALLGSAGPESIEVAGAVVSTVTATALDGPFVPVPLVAKAVNRCSPSASPLTARDQSPCASDVDVPFDTLPSKTSIVTSGSAVPPQTVMFWLAEKLPSAGAVMAGRAGKLSFTVQDRVAGVPSTFPAASTDRTARE